MQSEIKDYKNAAYKLLGIEVAITATVVLFLLLLYTKLAAYSALLGGLAYIFPNIWFIRNAYRGNGQTAPRSILSRFYIGEAGKLVLTGIFFALCFLLVKEINVAAMFLTFILMIIINLAGLAMMKTD